METTERKIKFKISLTGIEVEASGYETSDLSKLSKDLIWKAFWFFSISFIIGFLSNSVIALLKV